MTQIIFVSKVKAHHANTGPCMTFRHLFSLATFGCKNFSFIFSDSCLSWQPEIVSKLLHNVILNENRLYCSLDSEHMPFS